MSIDYSSQVNTSMGGAVANNGTTGQFLAANGNRRGFFLQNQATAALFVKFGTGCSTTVYDAVLKGGAGAADGSGGAIQMEGPLSYTGIISVAASGTASFSGCEW